MSPVRIDFLRRNDDESFFEALHEASRFFNENHSILKGKVSFRRSHNHALELLTDALVVVRAQTGNAIRGFGLLQCISADEKVWHLHFVYKDAKEAAGFLQSVVSEVKGRFEDRTIIFHGGELPVQPFAGVYVTHKYLDPRFLLEAEFVKEPQYISKQMFIKMYSVVQAMPEERFYICKNLNEQSIPRIRDAYGETHAWLWERLLSRSQGGPFDPYAVVKVYKDSEGSQQQKEVGWIMTSDEILQPIVDDVFEDVPDRPIKCKVVILATGEYHYGLNKLFPMWKAQGFHLCATYSDMDGIDKCHMNRVETRGLYRWNAVDDDKDPDFPMCFTGL